MSREPLYSSPNESKAKMGPRFFMLCGMIVIVVGGIVALAVSLPDDETSTLAATTRPASVNLPGTLGTPRPWEYNPQTDQHWDPTPGHEHWHNGRPPAQGSENPEPWFYNESTKQHWDPRPGHVHWHDGQPPPPEDRQ